jgi:hypothetical protein
MELASVGTYLDNKGITYPMLLDGTPDKDGPALHLLDIDVHDWWTSLSEIDLESVLVLLRKQSNSPEFREVSNDSN